MTWRPSFVPSLARAAVCAGFGAALAVAPAAAQLARVRTAAPDAPKLLVLPFQRDNVDSALSLLIADGARERLRANHLDKFNTITRTNLCENLQNSGFPCDVPLDANTVRNLVRFMNVKFVLEGSMIRHGDSILVVTRFAEAVGADPQTVTASVMVSPARAGTSTGGDLVNRLMDGYRTFDEVNQCRQRLDAHDYPGALRKATDALHQFPNNAGAWVCIARIREAQSAPVDEVVAALDSAYVRDTLNTGIMRRLASKYQGQNDTTNLLRMLKHILSIDFRDTELRISTIQLMVRMGQADSAVFVANQALKDNPASVELLGAKAIAEAAGSHWDSAYAAMQTVSEIDSGKVDSLFVYRITNYARSVPDTTNWIKWVQTATVKFPSQLDNWYTLVSVRLVKGDSTGALEAAHGYATHIPAGADTSSVQGMKHHYGLSHYMLALLQISRQPDSAVANADSSVRADTTLRNANSVVYLQTGLKSYRDSVYATAVERLNKARAAVTGRPTWLPTAAFIVGLSRFRLAVHEDSLVEQSRNCDSARALVAMWPVLEADFGAGAAYNRELANQFLSNYIPAYKQRADAFVRNFCR